MNIVTVTVNPCVDKSFTVERVVADRKLAGHDVREYPGGGGINVARVITRLGGQPSAYWSCGGDAGTRLGRLLDDERVPHAPLLIEGEVRENLIVTDQSTAEQYLFTLPGPCLTEADRMHWIRRLRQLPPSVNYVVFSGSLPHHSSLDWYSELLSAVPNGTKIIVDAKQATLRRALEHGVYLVKPNVRELTEIVGRELGNDLDIEVAAREIVRAKGASVVVVSLGPGGAILATSDRVERFSAPSVKVRGGVGAGDSMVGAIVAALDRNYTLEEAVKFGVAAGAATVMNNGTELCRREDVERLYPYVHCQQSYQC